MSAMFSSVTLSVGGMNGSTMPESFSTLQMGFKFFSIFAIMERVVIIFSVLAASLSVENGITESTSMCSYDIICIENHSLRYCTHLNCSQ